MPAVSLQNSLACNDMIRKLPDVISSTPSESAKGRTEVGREIREVGYICFGDPEFPQFPHNLFTTPQYRPDTSSSIKPPTWDIETDKIGFVSSANTIDSQGLRSDKKQAVLSSEVINTTPLHVKVEKVLAETEGITPNSLKKMAQEANNALLDQRSELRSGKRERSVGGVSVNEDSSPRLRLACEQLRAELRECKAELDESKVELSKSEERIRALREACLELYDGFKDLCSIMEQNSRSAEHNLTEQKVAWNQFYTILQTASDCKGEFDQHFSILLKKLKPLIPHIVTVVDDLVAPANAPSTAPRGTVDPATPISSLLPDSSSQDGSGRYRVRKPHKYKPGGGPCVCSPEKESLIVPRPSLGMDHARRRGI